MFNTLNQISLTEEIHQNQRQNNQKSGCILDSNLICLIVDTRLTLQMSSVAGISDQKRVLVKNRWSEDGMNVLT